MSPLRVAATTSKRGWRRSIFPRSTGTTTERRGRAGVAVAAPPRPSSSIPAPARRQRAGPPVGPGEPLGSSSRRSRSRSGRRRGFGTEAPEYYEVKRQLRDEEWLASVLARRDDGGGEATESGLPLVPKFVDSWDNFANFDEATAAEICSITNDALALDAEGVDWSAEPDLARELLGRCLKDVDSLAMDERGSDEWEAYCEELHPSDGGWLDAKFKSEHTNNYETAAAELSDRIERNRKEIERFKTWIGVRDEYDRRCHFLSEEKCNAYELLAHHWTLIELSCQPYLYMLSEEAQLEFVRKLHRYTSMPLHFSDCFVTPHWKASGPSMSPTMEDGDNMFCVPLTPESVREVERGQVVSFFVPERRVFRATPSTYSHVRVVIVKRVAALEGDVVLFEGAEHAVPEGHCWVLGDNRAMSHDSTSFGALPLQNLQSRCLYTFRTDPFTCKSVWRRGDEGLISLAGRGIYSLNPSSSVGTVLQDLWERFWYKIRTRRTQK